jgi:ribosomal protein S27E
MNIALQHATRASALKIVCDECGSLSIRFDTAATSKPDVTMIRCGRCDTVRGTLADLYELAYRSTNAFEF